MATYIALLRKDPASDFSVDFPDFPGCVSAGRTLQEAKEMAVEALGLHTEVMVNSGEPIPSPSSLEDIMPDPDNADAIPFLVTIDVPEDKAVRVNVTFKESFLRKVDAAARARRLSRSAFLVRAVEAVMRQDPAP